MKNLVLVVLFASLLAGCTANDSSLDEDESLSVTNVDTRNQPAPIIDAWYREAPKDAVPAFWKNVDPAKIKEVSPQMLPEAEKLLQDHLLISASEQEVKRFLSAPLVPESGERLYLVRAVYLNKDTGSFGVFHKGTALWVLHSSLGHVTNMSRQVLVVSLPFNPSEVFVTCSSVE